MNIEELAVMLESQGVALYLEGDALRFRAPKGVLTTELKQQIDERRAEIVDRLREASATCGPGPPTAPCRCDVRHWVDESPQESRIRTHCGKCGRFMGYRPRNLAPNGSRALESGRHA